MSGSDAGGTAATQPCSSWAGSTWLSRTCKDSRASRLSCCATCKSSEVVLAGSGGQEIRLERGLILVCVISVAFVGSRSNTNAAVVYVHRAFSAHSLWLD